MRRGIGAFLTGLMILTLVACGQKTEPITWQTQYDLGVRYLSEGNYEEAIIAFTAAIEINAKRAEGYEQLAGIYILIGNYDEAAEIIKKGQENCGETAVFRKLSSGLSFLKEGTPGIRITFCSLVSPEDYMAGIETELLLNVAYRCPEDTPCSLVYYDNAAQADRLAQTGGSIPVSDSGDEEIRIPLKNPQWDGRDYQFRVELLNAADFTSYGYDAGSVDSGANVTLESDTTPEDIKTEQRDVSARIWDMLQQDGAVTYADKPELFSAAANRLGGYFGLGETAEGSAASVIEGTVNGYSFSLPVTNCFYSGSSNNITVISPQNGTQLLEAYVNGASGEIGWRGIALGDSVSAVLQKLGLEESLASYASLELTVCPTQTESFGGASSDARLHENNMPVVTISVNFVETSPRENPGFGGLSVQMVFKEGVLSEANYSNNDLFAGLIG